MKIIGKTKDGYLIEASGTDMAALHGFTSEYSDGYKREGKEIGYEVPVAAAREAMEFVRRWAASNLADAKHRVTSMANSLEKVERIFPPK